MKETQIRTIAKIFTYRVLATLITALWTGLGDAILIHIVLFVLHYVTERVWVNIKWGFK